MALIKSSQSSLSAATTWFFGGNVLARFDSYLHNRSLMKTALGVSLEALPVTSRVPQGSIVGPMLFLLYANVLPEVVTST